METTEGCSETMENANKVENPAANCSSSASVSCSSPDDGVDRKFSLTTSLIQSVPRDEQAEELQDLGLSVYDQTVFEEGIIEQVENAIEKEEKKRQMKVVVDDIKATKIRLKQIEKALDYAPNNKQSISKEAKRKIESIRKEKENKLKQLKSLRAKQRSLVGHVNNGMFPCDVDTDVGSDAEELDPETKFELENMLGPDKTKETERERMIRTGQMTPFGTILGQKKSIKLTSELTDFEKYLMDQAQLQAKKKKTSPIKSNTATVSKGGKGSKTEDDELVAVPSTSRDCNPLEPKIRKRRRPKEDLGTHIAGEEFKDGTKPFKRISFRWPDPEANLIDLDSVNERRDSSGSEYFPSGRESDSDDVEERLRTVFENKKMKKTKKMKNKVDKSRTKKIVDDGNQDDYLQRIRTWKKELLIEKHQKLLHEDDDDDTGVPDADDGYEEFEGGYHIPLRIWNKLYRYQQTCVRWLWELHCQRVGGIVGDEMGLGKTIQIIAYLAGLCESDVVSKDGKFKGLGPVIIVTPTTIMHQWLHEFHLWYPPLRVSILHETGTYSGTKESLIRNLVNSRGILITSYTGVVIHQHLLLKHDWHYIILDEGHKIRNPDARVTLACKQIRTPHRFILSGSPLQNHLKELWSLFDFIFPGKLGTLPVFMQQFAVPITQGGYSNASQVQVQTAYKCAVVLRDSISPYLLRRMKEDVKMNLNLPAKNEQVLFCRLTEDQRSLYKDYLESTEIKSILDGRLQVFVGLINLRKICNHADLYSGGPKVFGDVDRSQLPEDMHYGFWKRSGKMLVIESVLKLWHRQGHRVLLFSQSKQMLDILERFVKLRDYSYVRMDGGTTIGSRQPLIQKFNNDPSIFVFLLTTRVGGLGVNLTGANRVVIYDPDWNPSTDLQARERAWRIGQQRDVTIYRLLTSGTIEEKIYHRQIFKQFLTNRVLKDPKQRRFFKSNDLLELFVLKDDDVGGSQVTETSVIFAGTGSEVKVSPKSIGRDDDDGTHAGSCLSVDKLQKMKELAKKLSQKIGQKNKTPSALNGMRSFNNVSKVGDKSEKVDTDLNKVEVKNSRKHKKHKQNIKTKKKIVLDGEVIDNLVRRDTFKSTGQEEESSKQNAKHDAYVLQKLFAKTGVHTALKHDTIMDSGDPDYMLVEGEAERVARDAVKALKASRRQCYRAESGVPTWTGQNGCLSTESPRSKPQLRFGQKKNTKLIAEPEKEKVPNAKTSEEQPILFNLLRKKKVFSGETEMSATSSAPAKPLSSTELLATMKVRNSLIPTAEDAGSDDERRRDSEGGETAASTSSRSTEFRFTTEYDELLVDIRNYIAFQCNVDGRATTAEVLNQFRDKVPSQDSAIFKSLLTKICDFSRGVDGEGLWELKGEFR